MAYSGIQASRNLHDNMLISIMRSPLSFFDTTPIGRIVNRFSRDIETIDSIIPETIQTWMMTFLAVISTVIILCYSTPLFLAVAIPIGVLYYCIQVCYGVLLSIHSGYFYSASSGPLLLISAPDTARIQCRSLTPKRHRQPRVKDLLKVPTWRLEWDSNPQPFGQKA